MTNELVKITEWQEIATLYKRGGVPVPFVQEIFLLDCEIAGTGFVKNIIEKTAELSIGSVLTLVREPENQYDSRAIRVDHGKVGKLGYVPRKKNEILSRLMDSGKILYAKIESVEISNYDQWANISIQIFMKDL